MPRVQEYVNGEAELKGQVWPTAQTSRHPVQMITFSRSDLLSPQQDKGYVDQGNCLVPVEVSNTWRHSRQTLRASNKKRTPKSAYALRSILAISHPVHGSSFKRITLSPPPTHNATKCEASLPLGGGGLLLFDRCGWFFVWWRRRLAQSLAAHPRSVL